MNQKHLVAFEATDLLKFFQKYCVEKYVQRFLRTNGINKVGDLVALNETDFNEFLSGEHEKLRTRCTFLYTTLRTHRSKILDH